MIDSSKVRQAFRSKILSGASPLFAKADCAWESRIFAPQGKVLWLRETLLPVNGQAATDADECLHAIMQYDIFAPHASGSEIAEAKRVALAELFEPTGASGGLIAGSGVSIAVYEVSPLKSAPDDVWDGYPLHIKFRAYQG